MAHIQSKLLPELLGDIFIHTLPNINTIWETTQRLANKTPQWGAYSIIPLPKSDFLVPFTISSVCRRWNEVAIATQPLWSLILVDAEMDEAGFDRLQTWTERSGSYPVTFVCGGFRTLKQYPPLINQYLGTIFAEVERWENLYIVLLLPSLPQIGDNAHNTPLQAIESIPIPVLSAPLLRKAYVRVTRMDPFGTPLEEIPIAPFRDSLLDILMSPISTKLEEICLDGEPISRPISFSISHSITKIYIAAITTPMVMALLLACPNVEEFTLLVSDDPDDHLPLETNPTASLIYLRRLAIECNRSISSEMILRCMHAPSLTHLALSVEHYLSPQRLRDAFTTFLGRSECRMSSINFRARGYAQDHSSPLPLEPHYWDSLERLDVSGLPSSVFLQLHAVSPCVKEMRLGLPLLGTHTGLTYLPHIRQIVIKPNGAPAQNYQVLSNIDAPHLQRISVSSFIAWKSVSWQRLGLEDVISKSDNLSYMCLDWGWYGDLPDSNLVSDYLLTLLKLPNVNANLQTLIFRCHSIGSSGESSIMEYLTLSSSRNMGTVLPKLRDVVFIDTVDSVEDGKLADMVESRFRHGALEFFQVHFKVCVGQTLYDPVHLPKLHMEDESRLMGLMREGRNVVIDRGKSRERLDEIVEELEKRL